MNISKVLLFLITILTLLIFVNSSLSAEITEPIRDGDYIYIDDSKTFLKSTYSATHGEDIEHWAMTKQFTGDCDMAIGFDGEVAWPTKVLLEDPHYEYWDTDESKTFYYVTNFVQTTDAQDYGNWYNPLKYKFDHKIHIGYDDITNESIWQDVIGTVAYFDSQENDGTNYTITWHTEHSRLEQYRDISDRILSNPINYEFDGKNLWFITKDIPMTANEMRYIVIEMGGKIELGEHSYKYDIMWKPSHQSIPEARAAGNIYVLDPYLNSSWLHMKEIELTGYTGAGTDYQVKLEIGDSAGGYFHLEGHSTNFPQDLRITDDDGTTLLDHFVEDLTADPIVVHVKVGDNLDSNQSIRVYYGKSGESTASSISNTMIFGDDFPGSSLDLSKWDVRIGSGYSVSGGILTVSAVTGIESDTDYNTIVIRARVNIAAQNLNFVGIYNGADARGAYFRTESAVNRVRTRDAAGYTTTSTTATYTGAYNIIEVRKNAGTSAKFYVNDVLDVTHTTNVPNVSYPIGIECNTGTILVDWILARKFAATEPAFSSAGAEQSVVDSIYYNNTNSYNLTIESDGTIISNRSVVAADDTNDTAQSIGTSYLQLTHYNNSQMIVRNFTLTGNNIDWYQAANLSGSYSMKNSSGTIQTVNDGNFTIDLIAGDYWIEQADISIILISQTPSIIYTNSTGCINISYGITHASQGLNNTSVSFIYRNYDWDLSDSNHSIRPPSNNLASVWNFNGRILRAANRNETAGRLNFEDNDTITGGDIYTWSGLDENHTRLTIVPVNSTYTLVYINGTVHDLMPQMWYLDRTDQQEASKTQLAIHKTQNVLIKFWNFEIFKGNYDFLGVGYTDSSLNSNPALWPSDANPVNFYYVNSSYDPATGGDPITSGYAVYMGSLNASGWTDHVYEPCCNAKYVRGFIDNNYLNSVINTTNISYLYFTSNTESSKPYYINMTNVATSTNKTFADTNTLWAGNTPPYSLLAYTPNNWFAFMKLNMSLDHKLYAADNNDLWGSSTMNRTNITQALFPPTKPYFNAFHFNGDSDYDMNGIYDYIDSICIGVSSDPDGGNVTHNITIHYDNGTYVDTLNNTLTDKDIVHNGVYAHVDFNVTPYFSQIDNYTLRIIATDDENESITTWLGVNFSLDGSPRIISYSPETPVSSSEGENQTFSITTNLLGNVTWYLDSVEVFNETDVNSSSYSNENASLGSHNVTVITTNTNGSNSMMWNWNVRTELWSLIEDSVAWGISVAQYLVSSIGIVIVTAFSLVCILILMMLIGAALSVTKIIYR